MGERDLTEVIEKRITRAEAKTEMKEPGKYKVLLLNDDYTPMPFVVDVLTRFFYMTQETATQMMLQVHFNGKAVCGVFTRDIAETKVALVNEYAVIHEHPLLCSMEPE